MCELAWEYQNWKCLDYFQKQKRYAIKSIDECEPLSASWMKLWTKCGLCGNNPAFNSKHVRQQNHILYVLNYFKINESNYFLLVVAMAFEHFHFSSSELHFLELIPKYLWKFQQFMGWYIKMWTDKYVSFSEELKCDQNGLNVWNHEKDYVQITIDTF